MAEVTVKQLAVAVGVPVDRLLRQMREAGLPQRRENDPVSDDNKRDLLAYSKRARESAPSAPRRVALRRTSRSTLKSGQGRGGHTVSVQRKRRRIYVKGGETARPRSSRSPTRRRSQARPKSRPSGSGNRSWRARPRRRRSARTPRDSSVRRKSRNGVGRNNSPD